MSFFIRNVIKWNKNRLKTFWMFFIFFYMKSSNFTTIQVFFSWEIMMFVCTLSSCLALTWKNKILVNKMFGGLIRGCYISYSYSWRSGFRSSVLLSKKHYVLPTPRKNIKPNIIYKKIVEIWEQLKKLFHVVKNIYPFYYVIKTFEHINFIF